VIGLVAIVSLSAAIFAGLGWTIHIELFVRYRQQVAAECGADHRTCRFSVVEGAARPQEIYAGVVRVGELWLACNHVSPRSLV
jgi:hypothetical protein